MLRMILHAPWYISNNQIHHDLHMLIIEEIAKQFAKSYEKRLHHHPNVEAIQLLNTLTHRKLKRRNILDY